MKSPTKKLLAAGAVSLLLIACGKSKQQNVMEEIMEDQIEDETGGDADVDMKDDGSMHIESDEGTFDTGTDVPENWPEDVTVYADATVQYSASVNPTTGDAGMVLVMTTTDSVSAVSEFYKDELASAGWNLEGTMQGGGMTIMGGSKDNRQVSVMVSEADGMTSITLATGDKE